MKASDVSLMSETNWLTNDGIMFRRACGRMMNIMVCRWVRPVEMAASVCPFGIPSIPAFTICDM